MRTLCFGEALVDLISHKPVDSLSEADSFVAHLGGVSVNSAVIAARGGARIALAGNAGDDRWGNWLAGRLAAENLDLEWFELVEGSPTSVAFVTVDGHGEATYDLRGDGAAATVDTLQSRLLEAVQSTDALCFGSNMLADEAAARMTMAARERALELGHPIVFDPNVRPGRWDGNAARAGAACGACVPGAFLVKCNQEESRLMTGEDDAEAGAQSLLAAGAAHVIVTLGERGAILRGPICRDAVVSPGRVLSTVGAGDVFLGVMLGRLGATGFYPPVLPAGLAGAVEEAARACQRWGALD